MKTLNMNRVLIALDYNPTAQKVAEAGFSIAKTMNAEITLLHVLSDPVYYSSEEYSPIMGFKGFFENDQLRLNNIESLKKATLHFLDNSRQHLGDKTIQIMVGEGDYADSILKAAKEIKADLIILGSHSRKWLENILIGSVTEKVLRHTTVPLLIIPTKQKK
jgi:nucleotide-binding universal stress UspA family protein